MSDLCPVCGMATSAEGTCLWPMCQRYGQKIGEERRDRGIEIVSDRNAELRERLAVLLGVVCRSAQMVTSDELWKVMSEDDIAMVNEHPNIMGAVIRKCATSGLMSPTGVYVKTTRPTGQARRIAVWASLVFEDSPR